MSSLVVHLLADPPVFLLKLTIPAFFPPAMPATAVPPNHYPFKPTQIIKILPREPPTPLGALTTNIHARIPISSSFLADSETLSTSQLVRRLEELVPGFTEEIEKAREAVIAGEQSGERERRVVDDVVVTTLGTGSSLPSKYRNGEMKSPLSTFFFPLARSSVAS